MYLISSLCVLIIILYRNTYKDLQISRYSYYIWRVLLISYLFTMIYFTVNMQDTFSHSYVLLNMELDNIKNTILIIYFVGLFVSLIFNIVNYTYTALHCKQCETIDVNKCWPAEIETFTKLFKNNKSLRLYFDAEATAPYVFGVIRPCLYLSPGCIDPEYNIPLMLEHENFHMKRLDCLWRIIGRVIICIHWFNPVVYMLFNQMCKDDEISIDYRILQASDNCIFITEYTKEMCKELYIKNIKTDLDSVLQTKQPTTYCSYFITNSNIIHDRALAMKLDVGIKRKKYRLIILTLLCAMCLCIGHIRINTGINILEVVLEPGEIVLNVNHVANGANGESIDIITTLTPTETTH